VWNIDNQKHEPNGKYVYIMYINEWRLGPYF